jgi:1-aminocyclopropane-1-carboxylate deaminase
MEFPLSADFNLPSTLQKIDLGPLTDNNINFYVKRDDLIHPQISGNKYRKLKYNLISENEKPKGIITFGGAYSNHIYATAATCKVFNIQSVGIIRGEELSYLSNETLAFAHKCGMKLYFISREEYRLKEKSNSFNSIYTDYNDYIIIPEGGSNKKAVLGASEIIDELLSQANFPIDYLLVPSGTGGTAAGMMKGIIKHKLNSCKLLAFSSLKGDFLENEITNLAGIKDDRLRLITNYHFGGYAKTSPALLNSIKTFTEVTNIPIDHIYNGKLIFGFLDMLHKGLFPDGSNIVWIHTGGLRND